jgi:signal transduction histidine kinase
MTQLELNADLYEKLQARANQSGQTIEEWLNDQTSQSDEMDVFNTWFTRLVSHDIRTPLAAIMTSAEILKYYRARLTEERQAEHLDTVQMQVRMLNNLLDNIMIIQKYTAGTLVFDPIPQNLEELCREAVEAVSGVVYQKTNFSLQVDGTLPAVSYDEKLLMLALVDVLMNAVEYSAEGTPVEVTLVISGDQALIRVKDQGIGIPADEQNRVFELFYRASNVQSYNGHGLGLAVAQRIIDLHQGSVSIDSAPGQGTTITIGLPV